MFAVWVCVQAPCCGATPPIPLSSTPVTPTSPTSPSPPLCPPPTLSPAPAGIFGALYCLADVHTEFSEVAKQLKEVAELLGQGLNRQLGGALLPEYLVSDRVVVVWGEGGGRTGSRGVVRAGGCGGAVERWQTCCNNLAMVCVTLTFNPPSLCCSLVAPYPPAQSIQQMNHEQLLQRDGGDGSHGSLGLGGPLGLTGSMGVSLHSSGGLSPSTVTPATTAGALRHAVGLGWFGLGEDGVLRSMCS